jgi:protein TonB
MITRPTAPRENAAALGLSALFFCAVGVAGALMMTAAHRVPQAPDVAVSFVSAQPTAAAAAAPPAAGGASARSVDKSEQSEKHVVRKKRELVLDDKQAKQIPVEPTSEPEPQRRASESPAQGVPGGVHGGIAGGVAGGVIGGVVGGVPGGGADSGGGSAALPFGLGMTRPVQTSGSAPAYTREAIAARVEGKVIVRCVINVRGAVQDCKVIKGVPMLDTISVSALLASRFTPVTYQGRAEAVQYLFTFNFKLP